MAVQKSNSQPKISRIYAETFLSFLESKRLFKPFLAFAACELFILIFIFLVPRQPFVKLFGPPIRTIWGERFLHYPLNFILLPNLVSLSRSIISVFIGAFTTGVAVAIVAKKNFVAALKKYPALFLAILVINVLYYSFIKILAKLLEKYFMAGHLKLLFLGPKFWLGLFMVGAGFFAALFIQAVFAYIIPALICDDKKLSRAVLASLIFCKDNFFKTILLVGLPMLAFIPVIVLNYNTLFLIDRLFPEIIFWVAILGIVVNSLIVDPLVTVSTTLLYLKKKKD